MNKIKEMLLEFRELAERVPNKLVSEWKSKGKKVVGYFCLYVPQEIISAAGLLPYRLRPAGCNDVARADAYFSRLNCTLARSCLQFRLEGRFDFLDGLVGMNSCDHMRRLYDIWEAITPSPYMCFLSVPHQINERTLAWYYNEIAGFKKHIEKYYGSEIDEHSLKMAIRLHNETRMLIKELQELREKKDPELTGTDVMTVILAGMVSPKEQYNKMLKELLQEIKKGKKEPKEEKTRIMIAGSSFDDLVLAKTIEDLGAIIVTDAVCFARRYVLDPIPENGDLLWNLAVKYLNRSPCARMFGGNLERWKFIRKMVSDFRVEGIIYQTMRYCDLTGGERFYIEKMAKDSSIPFLHLEREYWTGGLEQIRTRVGAFIEMIEARKLRNKGKTHHL